MAINEPLPDQVLFKGQTIPATGLLNREKTTADGGYHLRFATNHPVPSGRLR
jgi:hypothetical protein